MRSSFLLLLFLLSLSFSTGIDEKRNYRGLASSWAMLPARTLAGLHYLFKGHEYQEDEGMVTVTGPVIEITSGDSVSSKVHAAGFISEIDEDDFEDQQQLARSVFEATTGPGDTVATAFLVGKDLVLTNRHVMGISPDSVKWKCGKFSVKLNHIEEQVECERVRYCSRKYDYCVVEMKKMASGKSIGSEIRPLRLASKVKSDPDEMILHIGNAGGLGLQASRGKGIKIKEGELFHYAPTLGGSSGAPLFNEKREVIGINWGHTGATYVGEHAFNRGVLMETIFNELRKTHPWTLKDIKSFRFWYRRIHGHRQVKIVRPKS